MVCKSPLLSSQWHPSVGFILTKWYVNLVIPVSIASLNSGFILTKWYVNDFSASTGVIETFVLY